MVDLEEHSQVDMPAAFDVLSPGVRAVLAHLCSGEERCRAFGVVVEWCETRGDCSFAVVCPGCDRQFVVDDDELTELRRWTDGEGNVLVCGVRWD